MQLLSWSLVLPSSSPRITTKILCLLWREGKFYSLRPSNASLRQRPGHRFQVVQARRLEMRRKREAQIRYTYPVNHKSLSLLRVDSCHFSTSGEECLRKVAFDNLSVQLHIPVGSKDNLLCERGQWIYIPVRNKFREFDVSPGLGIVI